MKFHPTDPKAVTHFVRHGYVVYNAVNDRKNIEGARNYVMSEIEFMRRLGKTDLHEMAILVMETFVSSCYGPITEAPLQFLRRYLGNDICLLGHDALWLNYPKDRHPVLNKGVHSDHWTGTSVNTVFVKTFFTDCDKYNGITVYPGSHLQGDIPVRNRAVDPAAKVKFKGVNLADIKAGDVLMWHALLLHKTTGHSAKNIRISMTSRYTSTETPFSSQERALGYRTLCVSPMNEILRLVGNDHLLPLRTYGGFVGIDKRMAKLYPNSEYKE